MDFSVVFRGPFDRRLVAQHVFHLTVQVIGVGIDYCCIPPIDGFPNFFLEILSKDCLDEGGT